MSSYNGKKLNVKTIHGMIKSIPPDGLYRYRVAPFKTNIRHKTQYLRQHQAQSKHNCNLVWVRFEPTLSLSRGKAFGKSTIYIFCAGVEAQMLVIFNKILAKMKGRRSIISYIISCNI